MSVEDSRLDAIIAEPRPRNAWEATDLGMAMVRQEFQPVYAAWFAVALPLFLLLHLLCWGNWHWISWLMWWLKPLLDRLPLYILSHALFGNLPTRRQFWRALPGLLHRQAFAALTWRRFDLARSFTLPVSQLEGLNGQARRQRLRDLGQPGRGPAVWLTLVCLHVEIALDLALITLVWMLIPDFVTLEFFDLFDDSNEWRQLWLNLAGFCGLSLVEPFYVAGGFTLYLNRRVWLEAWDLELGFRRMAERLARAAAFGALLMMGTGLWMIPDAGLADPRLSIPPCQLHRWQVEALAKAASPVQRELAETLKEPDLQICEQQEQWQWREDRPDAPAESGRGENLLTRWFAATVETALWFALSLFIGIAVWWLWRRRSHGSLLDKRRIRPSGAPPMTGRHETPIPPKADLGVIAWQLWSAGQPREALRLLYQGSLAGLATQYGLPMRASVTEEECLRLAAAQLADPPLIEFLRHLIHAWQATAYGCQPPEDGVARKLCDAWPRHFASTGALSA
ncbi:MAG TPA: DUF4129 domain-containing protein [Candidatus Competibacteraceae bacterium]|nr:DUF4129 domain-containing protein [Candidatus Competibacteraceae bacterium]HSA47917.1 DUF4129 domain-containing protein [Candidatus Competibacteraceae bacterium]